MKKHKNASWLLEKYWNDNLSLNQIANICNTTKKRIYYWMKKFNIPRRSLSEANHIAKANHCQLSSKTIEWIEGELLGDAYVQINKWSGRFLYTSKYKEYVEYISKVLKKSGIEQSGKIIRRINNQYKSTSYNYCSKAYPELKSLCNKWYSDGKKIVPKDIELTPLTCRQWFIGDGNLGQCNKNPYIRLATCGFSISDVEWLVTQLNQLGFKVTRQSSYNRIYISTKSTPNFINYIGKCPVKCYQYKWAI